MMFNSLNTSASALTAQRLRMDVITANVTNASTTRGQFVNGQWEPYRRKMVEMQSKGSNFQQLLQSKLIGQGGGGTQTSSGGVQVTKIVDDQTPFKMVYDPTHPDANADGYVMLPNVDLAKEMIDMLDASRSYEANITAFNTGKSLMLKALEIGK